MASLLWSSIFAILCLELALTFVLVLPVPRQIRNGVCRAATEMDLKAKLQPVLWAVGLGLTIALLDGLSFLQFIFQGEWELRYSSYSRYHHRDNFAREQEYQTERNVYLAGFSLTLIFVIGRITDLMQEHVELEEELENARKANPEAAVDLPGQGIELKPLQSKKDD